MLQGNIVFSNELHRRYADQGIVSVSLHPGTLDTELARHGSKLTQCLFVRVPRTAPPPTLLIDLRTTRICRNPSCTLRRWVR